MLNVADVDELLVTAGLDEHAVTIREAVRPGWVLHPQPAPSSGSLGASKIGGQPDLGADEVWPTSAAGAPFTFLAQVNCATLPAGDSSWSDGEAPLIRTSLLRCFANLAEEPGDCAAAVLLIDVARPLAPTPRPDFDAPPPDRDLTLELPEVFVAALACLTLPESLSGISGGFEDFSDRATRYGELTRTLRAASVDDSAAVGRRPPHQFLGEPTSVQDDVRNTGAAAARSEYAAQLLGIETDPELTGRSAWRTLLGLHWDDRIGLYIEDLGAYHLLIPEVDLRACRFDRVVCSVGSC
jgi:hypothetical protein